MKKTLVILAALALLVCAPSQARAITVDLELALLVDVSGSVSTSEFNLQRQGYVDAFNNSTVVAAIENGSIGSIAVTLVYWSGAGQQQQAVGWMQISDATTAAAFATAVDNAARPYSGLTGLGSALAYGGGLFAGNGFEGTREVIDVSGDGANNDGTSSSDGRASALGAGVDTINGVVIGGDNSVLTHYTNQVIGGVDKFVTTAATFADFGEAIEAKLITEIQGGVPEPLTLLAVACGIGGLGRYVRRRQAVVRAAA